MRTTIKDIAEHTGLSITTVSLVLNNKGNKISAATKERIFKAAAEMNYRPNQLALGLLTKKTQTLGLIIPDISNVFFSEFAKGVEDCSRQDKYNVILCNSNDEYILEQQSIHILADRGVDGIIIVMSAESFGAKNAECLSTLGSLGIPCILADCFDEVDNFSTMAIDNQKGSWLALRHLLALGHTHIGCVTGPQGLKTNKERLCGYTQALEEAGIPINPKLIYEGDFRYQSGYNATLKLLEQKPTALFCHNDMMAYGAAKALKESGRQIPADISLIGFDDIFFSQYMDVPLTTVEQPIYKMGQQAATVLLEEIQNETQNKQHILFEPRLIVRESTGAKK